MVVKQQEHEFVTAIKQMVANQDVAAIDGLNDNEWSVTYLIIAASHLSGDAKAVGARISSVPPAARRAAVVQVLRELATTRSKMAEVEIGLAEEAAAPNGALVEGPLVAPEVPFDNPVPVTQHIDAPAEPVAPPRARRRRVAEVMSEQLEAPAAQPVAALPAVDFDRAFGDVLSAVARNTAISEQLLGLVPNALSAFGGRIEAARVQEASELAEINRQLAEIASVVSRLLYNGQLLRDGVLAFEQELAINGVINNAVFLEATADWRS